MSIAILENYLLPAAGCRATKKSVFLPNSMHCSRSVSNIKCIIYLFTLYFSNTNILLPFKNTYI